MDTDPFVLECSGLPAGARVIAFEGTEEISTTYRYEIDLLVAPEADLGDAVGASATLTVHSDNPERGAVRGVIGSARIIENLDDRDLYRLVMVPRVTDVLGLDRHSRVFVGDTVPSIVQTLLREAGFRHEDCEFRLSRNYDPIDFVCQYRESTLDFLMRWMERDGIYFYFAHDGAQERLVVLDDKVGHAAARVEAPYQKSIALQESDGLRRFRAERHAVPGRVRVDDYDYLRPALPVRGEALVQGGGGGELRVRGAKVTSPKDAERIANLRAEGLRARQTIFRGEGQLHGLHAGELFTMSGHPRASLDGNYLVTKLHVRGHNSADLGNEMKEILGREDEPDEVLRVELEAIWGDVQFRPELKTQMPRVYSMEGGVIEGDVDSDYAQLDEHGRYLVKFRFDERDGRGSQASCRIRMMQPHAGSPEGMHFPLRKGTDVLVAFVGGDPDRPVIAGSVPNALTPSVVHSGNATRNVIHTGGGNQIQIEDAEGSQHIHLRTPHKNTYLHLGAPFNPSYTKTTATDGTSLSFVRDISTSLTGTDAQTLVEDSRLTVIGRAMIAPVDVAGVEVTTLVGASFLNQEVGDFMWAEMGADIKQAISDMQTLATAIEKLGTLVTAEGTTKPPTALDLAAAVTAVQSATKAAYNDMLALQSDAERYQTFSASTTPPPTGGNTGVATQWLTDVQAALGVPAVKASGSTPASPATGLNLANSVANPKPPDPLPPSGTIVPGPDPATVLSTVSNTFPAVALALNTDAVTFVPPGSDPIAPHGPPPFPTGSQLPVLPNPSAGASYLTITHPTTQTTSLTDATSAGQWIDDYVNNEKGGPKIQANDPTAMDVLDTGAYPASTNPLPPPAAGLQPPFPATTKPYALHSGSDVKVVGGDNVTLAAYDARSHTEGHAYSLVHGGQTSVVYSYNAYGGAVSWANGGPANLAAAQAADGQAEQAVAKAKTDLEKAFAEFALKGLLVGVAAGLVVGLLGPLAALIPGVVPDAGAIVAGLTLANLPQLISELANVTGADAVVAAAKGLLDAMKAEKDADRAVATIAAENPNRPTMPLPFDASTIAQVSTAYGNTRSWVDGSTDATITGDTTTTIGGNKTAWIKHDTKTTVGGSVTTHIKHDQHTTIGDPGLVVKILEGVAAVAAPVAPGLAVAGAVAAGLTGVVAGSTVTTNIWGNRLTTIIGSDTSLLLGFRTSATIGAQTSLVAGLSTFLFAGFKIDLEVGGILKVTPLAVEQALTKLREAAAHVETHAAHVAAHDVHVTMGDLISKL